METIFGSSLVGQLSSTTAANFHVGFIHTLTDEAAENIIKKNVLLWDDEPDEQAEPQVDIQLSRQPDGRYEIKWPWKKPKVEMEPNDKAAFRRFKVTESKMAKNTQAFEAYNQYFQDQLQNDFIEKAPRISTGLVRYLPHQAVIRQEAKKTKLRVVLDSSCKDSQNLCLNDFIEKGPNTMGNLIDIFARFRLHAVAMVADIEKAFLQISLAENQRDCVRFFWFDNQPNEDFSKNRIIPYRMKRLTFGVNASPYILNHVIQ